MGQLRFDLVVPDLPPNPAIPWIRTGAPPLSLSLLKALLPAELAGYEITVRCHHERTMGAYDVHSQRPDILALSVYTPAATRAYSILTDCLHATSWQGRRVRTLVGGHHATALPLEAIHHADAVVRGETTSTVLVTALRWLLRQIEHDGSDKRIFELAPMPAGATLPSRPIPDRSWYPRNRYLVDNTIQTSVGCAYHCSFCATTFALGAHSRIIEEAELEADIASIAGQGMVSIIDENFLASPHSQHTRRVCALFRRYKVKWQAALTAQTLLGNWRALIPLFAESGCAILFFGFETIYGGMRKSADITRYAELIRGCHDHGISVIGAFVFGAGADETPDIFEQTVDWATSVNCDFGYFGINTPFPGAPDFEEAVRRDFITDWNWEHYDTWYPVRRFPHISDQQMYDGLRNAYRWFYRRASVGQRLCRQLAEMLAPAEPTAHGYRMTRVTGILQGMATGLYLGTNRMMDWRTRVPYQDYRPTVVSEPNPLVLAQFADGQPVDQYDAHTRTRELHGEIPGRTSRLVQGVAPVEMAPLTFHDACAGGVR